MIGINDLPVELYRYIFRYLSIKDLLNCRLVNKVFFNFTNDTKIDDFKIPKEYLDGDWFYEYSKNESIKEEQDTSINFKCFKRMISLSLFNLEQNLNYLIIDSIEDNFNLAELSKLINLECLEIRCELYGNQFINQNQLKIFLFKFENIENDHNYKFYLKTPNLKMIEFNKINSIHLNNVETIKNIKTLQYDDGLKIFKNLEQIQLNCTNNYLDGDLLINFKNLNQLKILNKSFLDTNDNVKESIIKILNDRIYLKRMIDIFIKGVKITDIAKFLEIYYYRNDLRFQILNYELLDKNLPQIELLNYYDLECCIDNLKINLPLTFFDKYSQISDIFISNRIKNIDSLIWFLHNLKNCKFILISNHLILNQFFLNNLPLTIKELIIENDLSFNLDYNFIFRLIKLEQLIITGDHQNLDIEIPLKLFLCLNSLWDFRFNYNKKSIQITKLNYRFKLILDTKIKDAFNLLDLKGLLFNFLIEEQQRMSIM